MSLKDIEFRSGQDIIQVMRILTALPTGQGKLVDADITGLTATATVAKLKTMLLAKTVPTRAKNYLKQLADEGGMLDRSKRNGGITDAMVETARAAGSANVTNLLDAIAAAIPSGSNTDQSGYQVWAAG